MAEKTQKDNSMKGAFIDSLKRTNKEIKSDRAEAIGEDAQIMYRRTVEDLEVDLKRLKRNRENMLDMSPANTMSLMVAQDFDSRKFVEDDIQLGIEIRNTEIKLEIAQEQYEFLFGVS